MNNKLNISVGIPAHNEGSNIKELLLSLIAQKENSLNLKEIIVVSDGSTDDTVIRAREIKDSRIIIFENNEKSGKSVAQNKIIEKFTGDILIILDADILPKYQNFLDNLTTPFITNSMLGLTSGKTTPVAALTYLEKIINFSVGMKTEVYESINSGNNIFLCHGRSRAFSREFAKQLSFPSGLLSEDSWSYLMCIKNGFEFQYVKSAELLYRSPQVLKDHVNQSLRYFQGKQWLEKNVDGYNTENGFPKISKKLLAKIAIKHFIAHPILFISYICLVAFLFFSSKLRTSTVNWDIIKSSKTLK